MGAGFVCLKTTGGGLAGGGQELTVGGWPPCSLGVEPQLHSEMWSLAESLTPPCFYNGMMTTQVHCCCGSGAKSCPALWDPVDCSTPGFPVHHHLTEFVQTHVHWGSDAIPPSHPLSSPSPPALNLSQHQGLFQWASSSPQVAKVLEVLIPYLKSWVSKFFKF